MAHKPIRASAKKKSIKGNKPLSDIVKQKFLAKIQGRTLDDLHREQELKKAAAKAARTPGNTEFLDRYQALVEDVDKKAIAALDPRGGKPAWLLLAAGRRLSSKYLGDVSLYRATVSKMGTRASTRKALKSITWTRDGKGPPRKHRQLFVCCDPKYAGPISACRNLAVSCDCITGDTEVLTSNGWETVMSLTDPRCDPARDFPIKYNVNGILYPGSRPFHKGVQQVWAIELENGQTLKATADHKIEVLKRIKQVNHLKLKGRNQNGENNNNAYIWDIYFDDGARLTTSNAKKWAKKNGYSYGNLSSFASGRRKSYKDIIKIKRTRKPPVERTPYEHVAPSDLIPIFSPKKVRNLRIGDKVAIHNVHRFPEIEKDQHYWNSYFAGAFHGDGSFNPRCTYVYSWADILDLIRSNVGNILYEGSVQGRFMINQRGAEILHQHGINEDLGRHNIDISKNNVWGFLSGLIDTDGHVQRHGSAHITGSPNLVKIAKHFQGLGVPGVKFGVYREAGVETNLGATTKTSYFFSISKEGMACIQHNLCSIKVQKRAEERERTGMPHNEYTPVSKVKSITYAGKQHVYDIHVPEINRFIANSMKILNCEDFMYVWEYSLMAVGASWIQFGNGEPPVEKNPTMIPGICKHATAVLARVVNAQL